jgi:hypothetical protein
VTLRPGQKLKSAVSDVQVVVVRAPAGDVELACGGAAMVEDAQEVAPPAGADPPGEGPLIGKRYVDEEAGLELLCTRSGAGGLTVEGRALELKGAKPLPSSD